MWHFMRSYAPFAQLYAMTLDRFDKLILEALQRDGRISNKQLAGLVNLSESACLRRVRALEESGMIERYVAMVSQSEAGMPGNVDRLNKRGQVSLFYLFLLGRPLGLMVDSRLIRLGMRKGTPTLRNDGLGVRWFVTGGNTGPHSGPY